MAAPYSVRAEWILYLSQEVTEQLRCHSLLVPGIIILPDRAPSGTQWSGKNITHLKDSKILHKITTIINQPQVIAFLLYCDNLLKVQCHSPKCATQHVIIFMKFSTSSRILVIHSLCFIAQSTLLQLHLAFSCIDFFFFVVHLRPELLRSTLCPINMYFIALNMTVCFQ